MDKNEAWKDYWQEFRKRKQNFWDYAELGFYEEIKLILDNEPIDIDAKLFSSETGLHLAALNGHYKICLLLIEKGASLKITTKTNKTALHLAVIRGI